MTKEFSEWAKGICNEFAGPGAFLPRFIPMTGYELGLALMESVETHRRKGRSDLVENECIRVIRDRLKRRTLRKKASDARKRLAGGGSLNRERYILAVSNEFKDWFDLNRGSLSRPGIPPLTVKEYADALMAFAEMLRHSKKGDRFGLICKKLVDERGPRLEKRKNASVYQRYQKVVSDLLS